MTGPRKPRKPTPIPPYPIRKEGTLSRFTGEDCERMIAEWRRLAALATGDDRERLLRLADQMTMIDPRIFETEGVRVRLR